MAGQTAARVADDIERMILSGVLLPGQPIRQESMAETLGVSRLPIREALRHLTTAGLVRHEPNVGYTVARLDPDEFDQIYRMRAALEREVLSAIPPLDARTIEEIRKLGTLVSEAADSGDVPAMRIRNQHFHFAMFEQSGLHLIVAELRRLWNLAMPYHAAYLYDPAARRRVCAEHDMMIEALVRGDNVRLVELMEEHRSGGETSTGALLNDSAAHDG